MDLKITTLIENNPDDQKKLYFEHGFSLLIETDGKQILFDTGQSGDFIKNAEMLNHDLIDLDFVIISHGHYDHSGGFVKLVEEKGKTFQLIVGSEFFKPKYMAAEENNYKYNGNSFNEEYILQNNIKLKKVEEDIFYLTENIIIFHHLLKINDFEKRNSKFFIKDNSSYIPDEFDDEIVLGVLTKKGMVVIAGCSHIGIANILTSVSERMNIPVYAVIGGTHLMDADVTRVQKTIEIIKNLSPELVAVSHCTGEEAIRIFRQEFGEKFLYNNTGRVIEI